MLFFYILPSQENLHSSFFLSIRDVPMSYKGASVAHYQLGDLGIIPKPDQYIPTYFEKMRDATAVQQLGSLKKVLTRSVGVQTISTQKVGTIVNQQIY